MESLILLYDARCVLCLRTVDTLSRMKVKADLRMIPFQQADSSLLPPGLTEEKLAAQLHVIDGSGNIYAGADAVVRIMRTVPSLAWLTPLYRVPGLRPLAEAGYRWVAHHRYQLFGRAKDCTDGACSLHGSSNQSEAERDNADSGKPKP